MTKSRHPRHYEIAVDIVKSYNGKSPFPDFLSETFKNNKNWGSKDRRSYRELCYLYFKNARILNNLNETELVTALRQLDSGDLELDPTPYEEFSEFISPLINISELKNWYHKQPPVFFFPWRYSSDENAVLGGTYLSKDQTWLYTGAVDLQLPIQEGKGIIQDVASTQVVQKYRSLFDNQRVWDCCAGAGGKALILSHISTPKSLICSDVRPSILENLKKRFFINHKTLPELKNIDIAKEFIQEEAIDVDVILADVPCSGSGTWRRNPEALVNFQPEAILQYSQRQQIILQELTKIESVNYIVYCTCSLFSAENEAVIEDFLLKNSDFKCLESQFHGEIQGWESRGDYLFSALLKRN